jgi:NAD+ synthase (glutamine-hydrolysing)
MNIALLQFNPMVGDLNSNAKALLDWALAAKERGATLALAPELCLCGYPPKDLLDRPGFIRDTLAATKQVIEQCPDLPLVFGSIVERDGRLYNAAIAAQNGALLAQATKQLLPTYDVFDEQRYFTPGTELLVTRLGNARCAVSICEDAWSDTEQGKRRYGFDPLAKVTEQGCDLLVNLSASPFTLDKYTFRDSLFGSIARRHGVPVAMVNQVGANDELIFDGHSGVWQKDGTLIWLWLLSTPERLQLNERRIRSSPIVH